MLAIASKIQAGGRKSWPPAPVLRTGRMAEGLQTDGTGLNSQVEDFCPGIQEIS